MDPLVRIPVLLCLCFADIVSGVFQPCPSLSLRNGRVKYNSRRRAASFVCRKHFQLYGSKSATCVRGQWSQDLPTCIANRCTMLGDIPTSVIMVPKYQGALLLFSCHDPSWSLVGSPQVYCDGQKWSSHLPYCTDKAPKICDFERSTFHFCGWRQDSHDDFDWTLASGSTATADTGPLLDHTYSNITGHYIYIETSHPRRKGDTARLFSPLYEKESSHVCLEFFYHMTGNEVGKLEIFLKPKDEPITNLVSFFSREGDQGKEWVRGYIYLGQQDKQFQIVISASRGQSYKGDIAIDDIRLDNCDKIRYNGKVDTTTQPPDTRYSSRIITTSEPLDPVTKPRHKTKTAITIATKRVPITSSITDGSYTKISINTPVPNTTQTTLDYQELNDRSTQPITLKPTHFNDHRMKTKFTSIPSTSFHDGQDNATFTTRPNTTFSIESGNDQATNKTKIHHVNMKQSVNYERQESVKKNSLYIAIATGSVVIIVLMVALILTLTIKSKASNYTQEGDEFDMTSLRNELNEKKRFRLAPLFQNTDDRNMNDDALNVYSHKDSGQQSERVIDKRVNLRKIEKAAQSKTKENNFQFMLNRISYIDEDDEDTNINDCRDDETFFS